jgi:hypothetical protein
LGFHGGCPRAAFGVTPKGAELAAQQSRFGGSLDKAWVREVVSLLVEDLEA